MNWTSSYHPSPNEEIRYFGSGTQDGHGGRSAEHREEMRQIAVEVVKELAPQIAAQIYNESLQRLVGALQYDIETIVSVSLEDAKNIFNSAQCRRVISDRIMKELKARLDGLEFRI